MPDQMPQKLEADEPAATFLRDVLKLDAYFLEFGAEQIKGVFPHGGLYLYPMGHRLINAGEEGRDLFVIYDGKVEVIKPFVQQQIFLGNGDIFGEMALVRDGKRTANVITVEPSKIFFLPFQDLMYVVDNNSTMRDHLINLTRQRQ